MKRKITILTIAFLSSVLMCANVFAAATGRCGDSITWTLDDSGNLTLSGSGEMWNNGYDDSPFKDYEIRKATVKYGITSIGESAFSGCSGLEKIAVESGNSCYDSRDNCNSIIDTETNTLIVGCKNSVIPNSVTSIGYYAFYGCSGLTELTLPNSVTSIGNYAFSDCGGLEKITLPKRKTSNSEYYLNNLKMIISI